MPYPTNAYLPPSVRCHLPEHAQDIYHEAFNHAYAAHTGEGVGRKGPRIGDWQTRRSYKLMPEPFRSEPFDRSCAPVSANICDSGRSGAR